MAEIISYFLNDLISDNDSGIAYQNLKSFRSRFEAFLWSTRIVDSKKVNQLIYILISSLITITNSNLMNNQVNDALLSVNSDTVTILLMYTSEFNLFDKVSVGMFSFNQSKQISEFTKDDLAIFSEEIRKKHPQMTMSKLGQQIDKIYGYNLVKPQQGVIYQISTNSGAKNFTACRISPYIIAVQSQNILAFQDIHHQLGFVAQKRGKVYRLPISNAPLYLNIEQLIRENATDSNLENVHNFVSEFIKMNEPFINHDPINHLYSLCGMLNLNFKETYQLEVYCNPKFVDIISNDKIVRMEFYQPGNESVSWIVNNDKFIQVKQAIKCAINIECLRQFYAKKSDIGLSSCFETKIAKIHDEKSFIGKIIKTTLAANFALNDETIQELKVSIEVFQAQLSGSDPKEAEFLLLGQLMTLNHVLKLSKITSYIHDVQPKVMADVMTSFIISVANNTRVICMNLLHGEVFDSQLTQLLTLKSQSVPNINRNMFHQVLVLNFKTLPYSGLETIEEFDNPSVLLKNVSNTHVSIGGLEKIEEIKLDDMFEKMNNAKDNTFSLISYAGFEPLSLHTIRNTIQFTALIKGLSAAETLVKLSPNAFSFKHADEETKIIVGSVSDGQPLAEQVINALNDFVADHRNLFDGRYTQATVFSVAYTRNESSSAGILALFKLKLHQIEPQIINICFSSSKRKRRALTSCVNPGSLESIELGVMTESNSVNSLSDQSIRYVGAGRRGSGSVSIGQGAYRRFGLVRTLREFDIFPKSFSTARLNFLDTHLRRVAMAANVFIATRMAVTTGSNYANHQHADAAVTAASLVTFSVFYPLAELLSRSSKNFMVFGRLYSATRLSLMSRGVAHAALVAFLVHDLVQQHRAYSQGDQRALALLAGSYSALAVDSAALGLTFYSGWTGRALTAASFGGYVAFILTTLILMGVSTYYALGSMWDLDELLPLTTEEKWRFTLAPVFGVNDQDANKLRYMTHFNENLAKKAAQLFANKTNVEHYFFPLDNELGKRHVLNLQFTKDLQVRWRPTSQHNVKLACYGQDLKFWDYNEGENIPLYSCQNMMGFQNMPRHETNLSNTISVIDLYDGNDLVFGFRDKPNLFLINGAGEKQIDGGDDTDIFVILNDNITSLVLDGHLGKNILNLAEYRLNTSITIDFSTETQFRPNSVQNRVLNFYNINGFIGSKNRMELITTDCATMFVSTQGGKQDSFDQVFIPDQNCSPNVTVEIHEWTNTISRTHEGNITYVITPFSGQSNIYLTRNDRDFSYHLVHFDLPLFRLGLRSVAALDQEYSFHDAAFCIYDDLQPLDTGSRRVLGEVFIYNMTSQTFITTNDDALLSIDRETIHVSYSSKQKVEELVVSVPRSGLRLLSSIIAYSTSSRAYVLFSNDQTVENKYIRNPVTVTNVLSNNPDVQTHIMGTGKFMEVVYIPRIQNRTTFSSADVMLYNYSNPQAPNTLNLRVWCGLIKVMNPLSDCIVKRRISTAENTNNNVYLNLFVKHSNQEDQSLCGTIILEDGLLDKRYKTLNVKMRGELKFNDDIDNDENLYPKPIIISDDEDIVDITDFDMEPKTTLKVGHRLVKFHVASYKTVLVLICSLHLETWLTFNFYGYEESMILPTLVLEFPNIKVPMSDIHMPEVDIDPEKLKEEFGDYNGGV